VEGVRREKIVEGREGKSTVGKLRVTGAGEVDKWVGGHMVRVGRGELNSRRGRGALRGGRRG